MGFGPKFIWECLTIKKHINIYIFFNWQVVVGIFEMQFDDIEVSPPPVLFLSIEDGIENGGGEAKVSCCCLGSGMARGT